MGTLDGTADPHQGFGGSLEGVSFDSGYDAPVARPWLPFGLGAFGSTRDSGLYNTRRRASGQHPRASSCHCWRRIGKATRTPATPRPVPSSSLVAKRPGLVPTSLRVGKVSIYNGFRQAYNFQSEASAGSWQFAVTGGYAMECGSILDDAADTAISGYLYQNSDESNYGVPLPPGYYRQITTEAVHETQSLLPFWCGLAVAGDDVDSANVVGSGFIAAPDEPKSTPSSDLERDYDVLAYELGSIRTRSTCQAR